MKDFRKIAIIASLSALALVACSEDNGPTTGKTSAKSMVIRGAVTAADTTGAAGTVTINGKTVDTKEAKVTLDNVAGTDDDIKPGMVVTVTGTVDADEPNKVKATKVKYEDELEGEVTVVKIINKVGTITVMGQSVMVDATTQFENDILGSLLDINGITVGNIIEVSGHTKDGKILATRIELKTLNATAALSDDKDAINEMEVKGIVKELNTTAKTFMLGTLKVHYGDLGVVVKGTLANEAEVEVETTKPIDVTANMLHASAVEVEGADANEVIEDAAEDAIKDVSMEGAITGFNATTKTFKVDGVAVIYSDTTKILMELVAGTVAGTVADLKDGVIVEVEGTKNAAGAIVATEIEVQKAPAAEPLTGVDVVEPVEVPDAAPAAPAPALTPGTA